MLNNKQSDFFLTQYLKQRPAFFSLLRSFEANLFFNHRDQMKTKILDFGCGDGFFAQLVFKPKQIAIGLDINDSRADQAQDRTVYQQVAFYDGKKIPFKDQFFSTIISNSVLEHLADLDANLEEIHRVLKKTGRFYLTVMTDQWEKGLWGTRLLGPFYQRLMRKKQVHQQLYSPSQWQNHFKRAGFIIVHTECYLPVDKVPTIELWHYLSCLSLLTYQFFRRWVIWPNWYQFFALEDFFKHYQRHLPCSAKKAAAAFFVLEKK